MNKVLDPIKFLNKFWPKVRLYDKQVEVVYSVMNNDETYVPAGNMLGKDFIAGFIAIWFFLSRYPCRVVTTSADHAQLESVLWGEIRRFIDTAKYPLVHDKGGPLVVNHLHIRRMHKGKMCGMSYILGRVAKKGEGLLGHHVSVDSEEFDLSMSGGVDHSLRVPRTLFIADEASGVEDIAYERADTWAARKLIIGNPYQCSNFFYRAVKNGDILAPDQGE